MESTALDILIIPASLATAATVAACWAVSAAAGLARRLLAAGGARSVEAEDPAERWPAARRPLAPGRSVDRVRLGAGSW